MESSEPNDKKLRETIALLMLIADSERALQEGRWLTQEQMEQLMKEKFGIGY